MNFLGYKNNQIRVYKYQIKIGKPLSGVSRLSQVYQYNSSNMTVCLYPNYSMIWLVVRKDKKHSLNEIHNGCQK